LAVGWQQKIKRAANGTDRNEIDKKRGGGGDEPAETILLLLQYYYYDVALYNCSRTERPSEYY